MTNLANGILIITILSGIVFVAGMLYAISKRLISKYYEDHSIANRLVIISIAIYGSAISIFCFSDLHEAVGNFFLPFFKLLASIVFLTVVLLLMVSIVFFVLLLFGDLTDDDTLWFRAVVFIFGLGTFFLAAIMLLRKPLNGYLFPWVQQVGLRVVGNITLAYGAVAGVIFIMGFLWRIFRGGQYVLVTTYRRLLVLFFGGLYVLVISTLLLMKFNLPF